MTFIKERLLIWFDGLLARLLVRKLRLLDYATSPEYECDLNLLAAYLDHNLGAAQTRRLESHLADCRPCRDTLARALRSQEAVPDPELPRSKNL